MGEATRVVRIENLPKIGQKMVRTATTPALRVLVSEYLTDEDFRWVAKHLALCDREPIQIGSPEDMSWLTRTTIR